MMISLRMKRPLYRQILGHLEDVIPEEGCGLIGGTNGTAQMVYPVRNSLASPIAYEMDRVEQLEAMLDLEQRGLDLLAIYHSHPHGPAEPSAMDISMAYYPEAAYLIMSWDGNHKLTARAFFIVDGKVTEQELILN